MRKNHRYRRTSLKVNDSDVGATIEEKIERIISNKEPITDSAPIIYTEKKDGVLAAYNIRTDRFEIALDAINMIQRSQDAKRDAKMEVNKSNNDENSEVSEPRQATN